MEKTYKPDNIKVINIQTKEGVFVNEENKEIKYKNCYINFTIGENPLVYRAKIDNVLKPYVLQELKSQPIADSDTASDFWSE